MTDPIIGFRCWVIKHDPLHLSAVAMRYAWQPGNNEAICMINKESKHPAPADSCRCGLHARTTLAGCTEEYPYYPVHGYWGYAQAGGANNLMVMGAVLLWGDVQRGDKVIRASHSRILCFTDKPDPWAERTGSNNPAAITEERREARQEALNILCAEFSVPLVPYETCEMYAREFGEWVGDNAAGPFYLE